MKCKDCPHLQECTDFYIIDLYELGHFHRDMYDEPDMLDMNEEKELFLATEAWKHCSENKD